MTRHITPLRSALGLLLALGLLPETHAVSAQTLPAAARPAAAPRVPTLTPEEARDARLRARLPAGVPAAADAADEGEDEGDEAGGVVRVGGKKAGVLDSGAKKIDFDPKTLGAETPASATEKLAKEAEDVIEWTPNFAEGAKARCRKVPLDAKIRLDFNEIALGDLTKFISCITEQNFILTSGANKAATVSILSPKPVTAYEAYKAYLSALEANGLTIVPNGSFLEIVPNGEARQQGAPIFPVGKQGPNDDRIVTRLIQLEHVEAQEILPVIDKFKTKAADVTIYAPTNTIILTDTGTNIRRLLKLIGELDVPVGKEKIWIRPIQYADAQQVLQIMTSLFQTQGNSPTPVSPVAAARAARAAARGRQAAAAQQESPSSVVGATEGDITSVRISKMLADERTNSIILVASRSAYLRVDRLIRKIDVPIPGEGQIHIHPLENAKADEIASALSALASGQASSRSTRGGARGQGAAAAAAGAAGAGSATLFEGELKITPYEPTNSLIIESTLKDYLALQKVIRQLDVRRKQVYVEAIIMEISQNKQRDIGISGSGGATVDVAGNTLPLLFGVGGLGLDVSSALSTLSSGGGALGLQGPLLDVPAGDSGGTAAGTFSIPQFGFLLKALQTTSNVNVLSTPHILTVENEEAEIQVGQRQPYRNSSLGGLGNISSLAGLTGTDTSALGGLGGLGSLAGLGGLGSQVQYVDIDLTLRITPQVNASDFVRLEIDQSLDNLDGFFADAPITSTRQVRNVVVVRDGQPVVIGGLIRDQETKSTEKVPFLGDIPLLGAIFRRTSTTIEKRNLLVIIVPHVIKDPSDLKRIHEQRRKEYTEMARVMALRAKEFDGGLDYRKKTGLLEEIHETVEHAKAERQLREQSVFEASDFDTVGPPETHDIEYDPTEGVPAPRGQGAAPPAGGDGETPPPQEDER
ncbi:MAG: type II secretion system secretin GspD [Deltaproteobacteria bacterium]|nr:type II secretion system secretin GspD [Deltaproteobacteria bacterium]MCB9785188.1 type II secretion system secretin GspD [Deltaproteobacteria bacterium]